MEETNEKINLFELLADIEILQDKIQSKLESEAK